MMDTVITAGLFMIVAVVIIGCALAIGLFFVLSWNLYKMFCAIPATLMPAPPEREPSTRGPHKDRDVLLRPFGK